VYVCVACVVCVGGVCMCVCVWFVCVVCVGVALDIQHAKRVGVIILPSGLSGCLSETFLTLRRIQSDIDINTLTSPCKVTLCLLDFTGS